MIDKFAFLGGAGGGQPVGDSNYVGQPSTRGPQISRAAAAGGRGDFSGNVLYSSYNGSLRASAGNYGAGGTDDADYGEDEGDDLAMLRSANVSQF